MRLHAAVMVLAAGLASGSAAVPDFEVVGTFRAPGTLGWQGPSIHPPGVLVGPGPEAGSERVYLAFTYSGQAGALDVLIVDPATGAWRQLANPVPTEYGACLLLGPDGNIYVGTRPNAHILRLNPRTGTLVDLGQPAPGDPRNFIYQMAVGTDGKIYASTYPSARLLRCDPATGQLADLGRVAPGDAGEQYALWLAASRDGFAYEAVGTAKAHLVAHHLASGERRELLAQVGGYIAGPGAPVGNIPFIFRGNDGDVYAVLGPRHFRLRGWKLEPIAPAELPAEIPANRLADGRTVSVAGREIRLTDPKTGRVERRPFGYEGREAPVFRLGAGPGGRLFGSSILPLHLFEVDLAARGLIDFGRLSHGEVYSFLTIGDRLHMACYDGPEDLPLMVYDPTRAFAIGRSETANPRLFNYEGSNASWRPQAMIEGPGKKIFLGSVASYGSLEGPLTIWDPATQRVEVVTGVVPHQSIVTLAAAGEILVGGTTIHGGGGSKPTEKEAKLFLWDATRKAKLWETVPVPRATRLTDLLSLPDGKVLGLAVGDAKDGDNDFHLPAGQGGLFVFDPVTRRIESTRPFAWTPIYNSVVLAGDGAVWGLANEGIFRFDPRTVTVELVAKAPRAITAGFAVIEGSMFFACGASIYRYRLPAATAAR